MATMISEVYDALKEAGASEDKARKAAEAIAAYDLRFGDMKNDLTALRGDVALLKWMVGFNLAFSLAALWKLLG